MNRDDDRTRNFVLDSDTEHQVKSQIPVIVHFSERALSSISADHGRHEDVEEMHRAAPALMLVFRDEARRL